MLKINSTAHGGAGTPVIIPTNASAPAPQVKPAEETISLANQLDGMTPPFGGEDDEEDAAKQQSKVTANKMLADLLDKKSDPPTFGEGTSSGQQTTGKRKMSAEGGAGPVTAKRKASDEPVKATPSAANLYAEMAASILEDDESVEEDEETEEDISMEEEDQQPLSTTTQTVAMKAGPTTVVTGQPQPQQVITLPLRQQIIMPSGANPQQQVILTGSHQMASSQNATATLKTDSGYQTVPIIMQPQQQGAAASAGQQGPTIIQQRSGTTAVHAGQTQYVLATNPQGQTYVVATQSPMQQQMQTLLVTQTPQQQGTQQKTIIILQQQPNQGQPGAPGQGTTTPIQQAINSQGQKIIMTTPQGQQVVMTGGPATAGGVTAGGVQPQRQIVIQQHQGGGATGSNIIVQSAAGNGGGAPVSQVQKQIILSTGPQGQQYVKAPAPMDAISSVDNIPQHVIKTSTGLQIKPVHMQTQPAQQQTIQMGQKAVITSVPAQQQQQHQSVIQGGVPPTKSLPAQVAAQPLNVTPAAPVSIMAAASPILTSSASSSPVPQPASSPKISVGLSTVTTSEGTITVTTTTTQVQPPQPTVPVSDNGVEISWPYVCDWRGCPRRRFKSADEVFYHACKAHVPDTLDFDAEIFCQWGLGPNLCDGKPRKRFSLMTHFQDRHCTEDKFAAAVQRRLEKGISTSNLTHPVTIIRDVTKDADSAAAAAAAGAKKEEDGTATPTGVTGPSAAASTATTTTGSTVKKAGKPGTWQPTAEAVSIIKRREFKDNEFSKAWKVSQKMWSARL